MNLAFQNGRSAPSNGYFFNPYSQMIKEEETVNLPQTQQTTNYGFTNFNNNYPQYTEFTTPQKQRQTYMSTFQNEGPAVNTMFQKRPATPYEWDYNTFVGTRNVMQPTNNYQGVTLSTINSKQAKIQKQILNKKDSPALGESILKNGGQKKTVSIKVPSNVPLSNVLKNIYEQMYQTYFNKRPEQNAVESSEAKKLIDELVQRDMTNLPSIVLNTTGPSAHAQKNRPQVVKESTKKIDDFLQKMYRQRQVKVGGNLEQQHNTGATTMTQPPTTQLQQAATPTFNTQPTLQQKGLYQYLLHFVMIFFSTLFFKKFSTHHF